MSTKRFLKLGAVICLVVISFVGIKICIAKWRTPERGESASIYGGAYPDKYGNLTLSFTDFYEGLRTKEKTIKDSNSLSKTQARIIYGYEDISGRMAIDYKFDYARSFSEGLAAVELDGKWGYIDKTGEFVISPSFKRAGDFSVGLAAVELNGKWGYIDKKGGFVIPPSFEGAKEFSEGLASVELNGKWGYIDKTGNFVIPPQYYSTYAFLNGVARVWISTRDGGVIYIDKTGAEVSLEH